MNPIAISLSPNAQKDDVLLAIKTLLTPWNWFDESTVKKLERALEDLYGHDYGALAVNSGRSAEYLILKALGVGKDDEVIVQAFTCVAVPNSISWLGAKPVYVDIANDYNIDPKDLSKKINEKTRAIIVQNTFGIPADIKSIKEVVRKKEKEFGTKIHLIEDCAVSLGASYDTGEKVGTVGDASFFSFGRDKVISSVFGGMVMTNDKKLHEKIKTERDKLSNHSYFWVFQQLMHPVLFTVILPLYNIGYKKFTLGKIILFLFQKTGFLSRAVYNEEKLGKKPKYFPKKPPGALAKLALNQLEKVDKFNKHRRKIAKLYFKELKSFSFKLPPKKKGSIWLRLPIKSKNAFELFDYMKNKGILIGDWYKRVVMPVNNLSLIGYRKDSCPKAEEFAGEVVNLPTYPNLSESQAMKLIQLIKQWQNTKQKK